VAVSTAPAHPLVTAPCRVRRALRETHDTFSVELDVSPSPRFQPGQFAMLYVFGVGEVPISYSGDPAGDGRPTVHTTREVGPVTRAMARLRRGATLGVRGPYGRPWPIAEAGGEDVVLVAGGIGLAPLRPVIHAITARRGDFGRVVLLYGARSSADLLFRRDLDRWRTSGAIDVGITVDRGTPTWKGDIGVVTELIARTPFDPRRAIALICGPEIMMRFAAAALGVRGVPSGRIFLSLERNMKCAVGLCGRCQLGAAFVCKDGPVFSFDHAERLLAVREL
jgi:NAD(P)H-flavin reductase